jgi:hypothetical protein
VFSTDGSNTPIAVWVDGDGNVTVGGISFVDNGDGTVTVSGVQAGNNIAIFTDDGYDAVEVQNTNAATGKYSLDNLQVLSTSQGDPIDQSFDTVLTDSDGDTSTGTIDVTFAQAGAIIGTSGDDDLSFLATAGDDIIFGGAGDDTLLGGLGNDSLTGGDGADILIYQFNSDDGGALSSTGNDVVEDLTIEDVLRFDDVSDGISDIAGLDAVTTTAGDGGGNTVITFDATGETVTLAGIGEFNSIQAIVDAGFTVQVE